MPYRKPPVTPEWIKVSEAAARLGCHPKTVHNRIRAGTIPVRVLRIERVTRLNRSDFEAYLESLTTQLPKQP
ncbi:helix-turn-helix domain-containing protein [Streptomyces sp. NPDC056227]|uniref:helix-turn-helix domain-containing protein n=1 Tax=Streptomyces sp. NPDC056227 TaxID=3345753 RepID=UPI0035E29789